MMYETANYLTAQIAKKERELRELRNQLYRAEIRDFYLFVMKNFDAENVAFLESEWSISFMGKTVTLPNMAEICDGITTTIEEYMDNEGIEYKRGGDRDEN